MSNSIDLIPLQPFVVLKKTVLNEKEGRVLHAVEQSINYWSKEVSNRNYSGRNEFERDLCMSAQQQFEDIRSILLDRE